MARPFVGQDYALELRSLVLYGNIPGISPHLVQTPRKELGIHNAATGVFTLHWGQIQASGGRSNVRLFYEVILVVRDFVHRYRFCLSDQSIGNNGQE